MNRKKLILVLATVSILLIVVFYPSIFPSLSSDDDGLGDYEPTWTLIVDGLVDNELNLTFYDLLDMPEVTVTARLWCVDQPVSTSVVSNWTGVRLSYLLNQAGLQENAVKIAFFASDGFSTDLTIEMVLEPDILVAYKENDQYIFEYQGGDPPLRLVVPGKWGYKWITWLGHIEVVDYDFLGFYESRGYTDEADHPEL